ncbi:hypothetical protein LXL04_009774 [Taraxacum kok-saghyz]
MPKPKQYPNRRLSLIRLNGSPPLFWRPHSLFSTPTAATEPLTRSPIHPPLFFFCSAALPTVTLNSLYLAFLRRYLFSIGLVAAVQLLLVELAAQSIVMMRCYTMLFLIVVEMNKKEVFKLAKGFRGRAKNCIRIARERVEKALQYSYRDRRNKKRDMRSLWIERINAGTRVHGVNYGNFMHGLVKENIQINRKVLSELSMHEPYSFKALVDVSRTAFPGNRQVAATPKKEGLQILV